jgi:hypothetical protein
MKIKDDVYFVGIAKQFVDNDGDLTSDPFRARVFIGIGDAQSYLARFDSKMHLVRVSEIVSIENVRSRLYMIDQIVESK